MKASEMIASNWFLFIVGVSFASGGLVGVLIDGFSLGFTVSAIVGFALIVVGGMPIWKKMFGFQKEDE